MTTYRNITLRGVERLLRSRRPWRWEPGLVLVSPRGRRWQVGHFRGKWRLAEIKKS